MHNYIVLAAVVLPLIGVFQMENGAFGNSIGLNGYPNGATAAYSMYALLLLASYAVVSLIPAGAAVTSRHQVRRFDAYAILVAGFFLLALLVMLFGFGAWDVWLGRVAKGQFRTNLGSFGALAYLLINAVIPLLMAYAAVLYRRSPGRWRERTGLGLLFLATLIIGSTWGFKSTGVTMLLPALVVLFWNASLLRVFGVCCAIALTVVVFFVAFDTETDEGAAGLGFLLVRLTTLQGDVSWYLWDQYVNGVQFPSYFKTLLPVIGDNAFSALTGIARDDAYTWAEYHFDILLGLLAGLPVSVFYEGHSIVGTPFADGLVMAGMPGVMLTAVFGGALAGGLCCLLSRTLKRDQGYRSALLATYFGIYVTTFLRNGVALQLFHVATVVGLLVALCLCVLIDTVAAELCLYIAAWRAPRPTLLPIRQHPVQ